MSNEFYFDNLGESNNIKYSKIKKRDAYFYFPHFAFFHIHTYKLFCIIIIILRIFT